MALSCETETTAVVWHVGDSNMYFSLQVLHLHEVEHGYEMRVPAAVPGVALARDMAYWRLRFASALRRGMPDAVVVSLGANDLGDPNWALLDTIEEQDRVLDQFLKALPKRPVMWIALQELDARRVELNAALRRAERRWAKLDVVTLPCVVVGSDQVHYDANSQTNLAVEVTYWLDRKFGYTMPNAAHSLLRQGPICSR
jgi:hypothetical protein